MSPQYWRDSFKTCVCRSRKLARVAASAGVITLASVQATATPPQVQPDTPIHFTQSDFTIPFQVKPGGRCPQYLDLLLSRDGGRTWQIHQSAAPAEGRFRLAQVDEGDYWLKVQVRDSAGASLSPSTLHLAVDKTCPKSTIQCDWQGDRTLLVHTTVEDLHLDAKSLQLTLRTDTQDTPVSIPIEIRQESSTTSSCEAAIEIPDCKSFELRLTATDLAGNKLATSERYFHPVLATDSDALLPATDDSPVIAVQEETAPVTTETPRWTTIEIGAPTTATKAQLTSSDSTRSILRKSQKQPRSLPEELIPPERAEQLLLEPPATALQISTEDTPAASAAGTSQITEALDAAQQSSTTQAASPVVPAQVQSASRKIKINYDLRQSVPSDQLNVELWVTTDRGASWEFWGLDRDALSPAWIEVDRNGDYGFCVVCVHADSDTQFRPKPGDRPDLLVKVNEPPARRRLVPAARN